MRPLPAAAAHPSRCSRRVNLRPAIAEDASSLAAIAVEVWIGTYLRNGVNGFFADFALDAFTPAKFAALIDDPHQIIIVCEDAEGITGFIRVAQDTPAPVQGCPDTEIATLYVQPRHHGKGIGKALLKLAVQQCRAAGHAGLWLATNAENTPAIAFYLSQGFTHVGETHFRIAVSARF